MLNILCDQHHIAPRVQSDNLWDFLDSWTDRFSEHIVDCYLPFFSMWIIWKARNLCIFEGKKVFILSIVQNIGYLSQMYGPPVKKRKKTRVLGPGPNLVYPCGFLDGASTNYTGGVDIFLYLNETHSFEFVVGSGQCTNTKAKLIGLWALLLITQMMGITNLRVFGDS